MYFHQLVNAELNLPDALPFIVVARLTLQCRLTSGFIDFPVMTATMTTNMKADDDKNDTTGREGKRMKR